MKKRKLFIALALAGAFTFSLASCGGNSGVTLNSNTTPPATTSGGELTNTGYPTPADPVDPVVEKNFVAYMQGQDIFAVLKNDNKLTNFAIIGQKDTLCLSPNYKDNKIVGFTVEKSSKLHDGFYLTIGENFVNNYMNEYFFSLKNNEVIISKDDSELAISFDGSSTATKMIEIESDKEFNLDGLKAKIVNNQIQISRNDILSVMQLTDLGIVQSDKNTKTNEILNQIVFERKGNIKYEYTYESRDEAPLNIEYMSRKKYDSNNRIIEENEYYTKEYGISKMDSCNYFYDENGLLIFAKGNYGSDEIRYEYDQYGRITKEEYYEDHYTEYQYNENGTYASVVELNPYTINPTGKFEYVYENNKIVKKNIYKYDYSQKTFGTEIYATYTSVKDGNTITETYDYKDGTKYTYFAEFSSNIVIIEEKRLSSEGKITSYSKIESLYNDGHITSDATYALDINNNQTYKRYEETYQYTDNSNVKIESYYDSTGEIDKSYKIVNNLNAKGYIDSIYVYKYDSSKNDYSIEDSHTIINRDQNNIIISTEEYDGYKKVINYEYENGVISKSIELLYTGDSNVYTLTTKKEKLYANGMLTDYKEYDYNEGKEELSEYSTYNEFFEKTTEIYYDYGYNNEITRYSYKYEYSFDENGNYIKYAYKNYDETAKDFIDYHTTDYTYYDNGLISKEVSKLYGEYPVTVTLENIYDSLCRFVTQIKTTEEVGKPASKIKQVYNYEKDTTEIYEYKDNAWSLVATKTYIYDYLNSDIIF